jgi:hypothetical protein
MQFQRNKYNESQQLEFDEMAESGAKAQHNTENTHTHTQSSFLWLAASYIHANDDVCICLLRRAHTTPREIYYGKFAI